MKIIASLAGVVVFTNLKNKFLMTTKSAFISFILCSVLLAKTTEVNATLIASGSVVSDTTTHLEWLKVTETYGVSYAQLLVNLSPGNIYAGWNIASATQVLTLLGDAGLPSDIYGFKDTSGQYTTAMSAFQNLMGAYTTNDPWYLYTRGIVSDSPTPASVSWIWVDQWTKDGGNPSPHYVENCFYGVNPLSIDEFNSDRFWSDPVGAWLVRETEHVPVPEPSTIFLLGGGLLGFIVWKKRSTGKIDSIRPS